MAGIFAETLPHGGDHLADIMQRISLDIENIGRVLKDWRNAIRIPLYKSKVIRQLCLSSMFSITFSSKIDGYDFTTRQIQENLYEQQVLFQGFIDLNKAFDTLKKRTYVKDLEVLRLSSPFHRYHPLIS